MSFFSKGDFKTREEWLKKQRKDIMKKESDKFHEFKSTGPASSKNTPKLKETKIQSKQTLKNILTLDTQTTNASNIEGLAATKVNFKNQKDGDLYRSMTNRAAAQESTARDQREQIKRLQKQIQIIKSENAILKGMHSEASDLYSKKAQIESENARLSQLFGDMENYLNQHGAFWEQGVIKGNFDVSTIKKDIKEAKTDYRTPKNFQLSQLLKRINELNESLMEQFGSKKFALVSGVYRIKEIETIDVKFFKDGLQLGNLPFLTFASKDGRRVLGDLVQGYYPHILKDQFPDGVIMNAQNHTEKIFSGKEEEEGKEEKEQMWFGGQGVSLQ